MRVMHLISSGIDSPVAARRMSELGVEVYAVHMSLLEDQKEFAKITKLAKNSGVKKLFVANLSDSHMAYKDRCWSKFTCLFCKRMMLRIAEKLAEKEGCDYLMTGENMGQVASQTLKNMVVTTDAVKMQILRPLLGLDKNDIIKMAREYGTFDTSIEKSPPCPFLPEHPATRAKLEKVRPQEEKLNVDLLVNNAVKNVKVIF